MKAGSLLFASIIVVIVLLIATLIYEFSAPSESAKSAEPELSIEQVSPNTVRIQEAEDGTYTVLGKFSGALTSGGDIISAPKPPIVYVFRGVPQKYAKYDVEVGGAYLLTGDGMKFLENIDLSLSDGEIFAYVLNAKDRQNEKFQIKKYKNYSRIEVPAGPL